MKTLRTIIDFICISQSVTSIAQEEKTSKFELFAYGGIGYTQVENENQPDYDLNVNTGELLLNYKPWNRLGFATGIGYSELSGNGFNALGNFYHKRSLIKIPLLVTINHDISENLFVKTNLGVYTQIIVDDSFEYLGGTSKDVYNGLNFGAQVNFAIGFKIDTRYSIGLNLSSQSDFSSFETVDDAPFTDEQKLKNLSSLGIFMVIGL